MHGLLIYQRFGFSTLDSVKQEESIKKRTDKQTDIIHVNRTSN